MRYFVQLKLLVWKNWILRKRNKLRTAIEFLWPIVIFSFLILLHNLGVRNNISNCYFKPKAMPSAGGLLFIQTLLCSINNTCDKLENSTMDEYNQSLLSSLGFALKEAFGLKEESGNVTELNLFGMSPNASNSSHILNRNRRFQKIEDDVVFSNCSAAEVPGKEVEERKSIRDFFVLGFITEDLKDSLMEPAKCNRENPFVYIIKSYISEKKANNIKRQADEDVDIVERGKRIIMTRSTFSSLIQYVKSVKPETHINGTQSIDFMKLLDSLFCGPRVPSLTDQIRSVFVERSFSKKHLMKESIPNSRSTIPVWENDTTEFCNELMKNLSSKDTSKVIFGLLKPFFRGKILYTPDAPIINRLMSRINDTFNKLMYLKDLIIDVQVEDSSLYEIIKRYRDNFRFLKKIVRSEAGKEFLKYYGRKTTGVDTESEVIESDAVALGEILEETAEHLRNSTNGAARIFDLRDLKRYLECIDFNRVIPVLDEKRAVQDALKWLNEDRLAALIVFPNVSRDAEELPPSITYKIRTGIERTPKTTQIRDRIYVTGVKRNVFRDIKHITGGFSFLQNLIETELIKEYTGREKGPGIYMQQMPFPCHIHDSFIDIITRTLPVFMVISWCYTFGMVIKKIVAEKENHLKGTMRIYGVYNSQHWIAWFVDAYVPVIMISFILSVMLVFGNVIPNSDFFLIWLFIVMYALPTICFAFLVSIFFSKSSFALNVSMVIFFLLYLIYPPIQNYGEMIHPTLKLTACIVSNVAFGLGCTWIANMEELGLGARFRYVNYSPIPGNPITMCIIMEMFLVDSIFYLLIALYLENVYRVEESVRLPWNYFITKAYWKNTPRKKRNVTSAATKLETDQKRFEEDPEGLTVGIETINLTKDYGNGIKKKRVVNNLSMKFYENQITSFLGHNGAGKTTSISMMSGLLPSTSGAVLIYGVNLEKNPDIAGKDIGICRQENVLLDELTVEEHLWLFSRLKNRSVKDTEKDAFKIIKDLQLDHRAKSPVYTLSGGMKRKVCLAMAFIGGPRTIFLDEPTAGVDPFSRRSIWDLLIKYKEGRTLILTTHFLDEADLLGDRIAIIGNGKLQCCGSSVFLKNNFGRGYYLTFESMVRSDRRCRTISGKGSETAEILSPQALELKKLITRIIPDAQFLEEIGNEITFILPLRTDPGSYDDLFTTLDNNKSNLNFLSYGISNTSLVEVFFTITQRMDDDHTEFESMHKSDSFHYKSLEALRTLEDNKLMSKKMMETGITERALDTRVGKIITQQFFALLIKRFHHHRRNYKLLIVEILLPAIFIAIALLLVLTLPSVEEMPPLAVDISAYSPSMIFYRNNFPNDPLLSLYEKALLGPYGLGTKCILKPESCHLRTISRENLNKVHNTFTKNCSCENGNYYCKISDDYQEPPKAEMSSGDLLYNLTSLDLVNWLITSELNLSDVRYGGVEFGYFNVWTGIELNEFFNMFMVKKFITLLAQIPVGDKNALNLDILSDFLATFSFKKDYGEKLFKSANLTDNIIVWYNNRGWIAGMAYMNGVSNLVLRASLPKGKDPSKYSIRLVNHPLPITERQLEDDIEVQINTSLLTAIAIIWALSFIPAMFVIYIVEERMSGLKHLQIVSGISKSVYWIVALLWDMMLYTLNVLTIVILFISFDIQTYINEDGFSVFVSLLYAYGFANITFVYAVSYMFITPSIAFVFVACYNIFVGMITLWTTFFLDLISNSDDPLYLKKIFLIFPPFCFGRALVKIALAYNNVQILKNFGLDSHINYASWSISTKYVIVMIALGVFFFITTIVIQFRCFPQCFGSRRVDKKTRIFDRNEEEDVKKERDRVEARLVEKVADLLVVNNLTKFYLNSKTPAVDGISFGVKSGECFGLLGLNGAGKTTVFKMLTGP
ncbi:UNVERIFIED_CONTAM: hypothetical protein PYX00_002501 [Menopon gallinae]|uniref:ABC transporter domain-containing protein n=1 Tax=Menopon gallinae TaxID=328185 RepID=A0AAW2IHL2_9NEOP